MPVPTETTPTTTSVPLRPRWLPHEEFPFRIRSVRAGGAEIRHVDEGSGPVLLFLHAGPAWCFVFRDLILELRRDFRCVAPDLPGTGLSPATPGIGPTLPAATDVVRAFVEAKSLEGLTLVAHDVGGPVGLAAAVADPRRYEGVAVCGSFAWPLHERAPKMARMLKLVGSGAFRFFNRTTNLLALASSTSFGVGRRLSRAGRRAYRGPFRDVAVRERATAMLGDVVRRSDFLSGLEPGVRRVLGHLPCLLVFGEHDPGREAGFPEGFRNLFSGARSVVIRDGHHFPQAEFPHGVARALRAWHREEVRVEGGASEDAEAVASGP